MRHEAVALSCAYARYRYVRDTGVPLGEVGRAADVWGRLGARRTSGAPGTPDARLHHPIASVRLVATVPASHADHRSTV